MYIEYCFIWLSYPRNIWNEDNINYLFHSKAFKTRVHLINIPLNTWFASANQLDNNKIFPRRRDESTLKGCTALAWQIFSRDVLLLAVPILPDLKDLCVGRLSQFWIHLNSSWNAAPSRQLEIYAATDYRWYYKTRRNVQKHQYVPWVAKARD